VHHDRLRTESIRSSGFGHPDHLQVRATMSVVGTKNYTPAVQAASPTLDVTPPDQIVSGVVEERVARIIASHHSNALVIHACQGRFQPSGAKLNVICTGEKIRLLGAIKGLVDAGCVGSLSPVDEKFGPGPNRRGLRLLVILLHHKKKSIVPRSDRFQVSDQRSQPLRPTVGRNDNDRAEHFSEFFQSDPKPPTYLKPNDVRERRRIRLPGRFDVDWDWLRGAGVLNPIDVEDVECSPSASKVESGHDKSSECSDLSGERSQDSAQSHG
jgi:hypothetical protein